MREGTALALLFPLAFTAALIAYSPLPWTMARMGISGLAVEGQSGSVLAGEAAKVSIGVLRLERVRWFLEPMQLLAGCWSYRFSWADDRSAGAGTTDACGGGVFRIRDLRADVSPEFVVTWLPKPSRVEGSVGVELRKLEVADAGFHAADGMLRWQDAAATVWDRRLILREPLLIRISGDAGVLVVEITDEGGRGDFAGRLRLTRGGEVEGILTVANAIAMQAGDARALALLGGQPAGQHHRFPVRARLW